MFTEYVYIRHCTLTEYETSKIKRGLIILLKYCYQKGWELITSYKLK